MYLRPYSLCSDRCLSAIGDFCSYQYQRQPGKAISCKPEGPLPLKLRCQVTGVDNFTIQWHHSNSSSPPSLENSTSIETLVDNLDNVQNEELPNAAYSLISVLTIRARDYDTVDGYYWCTVNASHPTPNPSQVLRISTCPFIGDSVEPTKCSTEVELSESKTRCASNNASIDIVDEAFGSIEQCEVKNSVSSTPETSSNKETTTQATEAATADISSFREGSTITTIQSDETFPILELSSSSGFPMYFIWMIIGIAFAILVVIIVLMLVAIVYLSHKRNEIRGTYGAPIILTCIHDRL